MHTLKLTIPDVVYPEIISFLKKYPSVSIDKNSLNADFVVSNLDEAKKRVEMARNQNIFIEEKEFWNEIDEHISKI